LLTLLDGGRATEPETLAALRDLGYSDADAQHKVDVVSARRVASAKGTTITDVHAKYKKQAIDAEVAISTIEQLGVPTWAATAIVHSWALGVGAVEPT
jgi:Holliday junction resolvasome RuvABC DNA-binding subunit